MSFVVDASVAIKWFIEENLSEEAGAILGHGEPLFAPDLLLAEIGNVLWKKVVRGEVAPDQAHEIAAKIEEGIPVLYSMRLLNARALQIALPIYDCFYLACAEAVDGVLVTADRKLLDISKGTAFEGRVRHLGEISKLAHTIPPLRTPLEKIQRVIELNRRSRDAAGNVVRRSPGNEPEGVRIMSPKQTRMMDDTPPRLGLIRYLDSLSEAERLDLLALSWLGREHGVAEDWQTLRDRAAESAVWRKGEDLITESFFDINLEEGLNILWTRHPGGGRK
jgi:predicted nucleic acid-binding protein